MKLELMWRHIIICYLAVAVMASLLAVLCSREIVRNKKADFQRGELSAQTIAYSFLKKNYGERPAQDYLNYLSVLKSKHAPQGIEEVLKGGKR